MQTRHVDVAIIGAGTAGMGAYRAARQHTNNLVLIEGGHYGTTCARVGCMPSKLLIAAAEAAHQVQSASLFGLDAQLKPIDGAQVLQRVRQERDRFVGFVKEAIEEFDPDHQIIGKARFQDNETLLIDERLLIKAKRIVIATGSRPTYPAIFRQAEDRLLVNDDLFELEHLPESVVVFGPGVIGLELGQALARLGVRVRVLGRGGGLGPLQDEEIRTLALQGFNREFYLDTDAQVHSIQRVAEGVAIDYEHQQQGRITEVFDYLLAATGRQPNVDQLGLEQTDLALDERGVPEFDPYSLRAGQSNIFIAGDANNQLTLLHEAADEGRIAGDNAGRYPTIRAGERRTPLGVVFTDPQMASVGLNPGYIQSRYPNCHAVGSVNFADQGRSRVIGKNYGMLKLYGEQGTGLLLGAEMLGPAAEHIGHLLSWAIQQRLTVNQALNMPFYHPVIEEGVRTALRDLQAKLLLGPEMIKRCMDAGPGA